MAFLRDGLRAAGEASPIHITIVDSDDDWVNQYGLPDFLAPEQIAVSAGWRLKQQAKYRRQAVGEVRLSGLCACAGAYCGLYRPWPTRWQRPA